MYSNSRRETWSPVGMYYIRGRGQHVAVSNPSCLSTGNSFSLVHSFTGQVYLAQVSAGDEWVVEARAPRRGAGVLGSAELGGEHLGRAR